MGAALWGTAFAFIYYGLVIAVIAVVLYFVIKFAIKNGINESKLFKKDVFASNRHLSTRK